MDWTYIWVQFYDHFFEWGLKEQIRNLIAVRSRNGVRPNSGLTVMVANSDLYVAAIDEKIIVKIGPRYDVGNIIPSGYKIAASGKDYCVWEKR